MVAAGALLVLLITVSVFIYRLGVLKEKNKHLHKEITQSEARILRLVEAVEIKEALNKELTEKIAKLEPQIDSIYHIVEQREITILKTKRYGEKAINDYLALPFDEREKQFARLIGR